MSLIRTALRIAAFEALLPHAAFTAGSGYPTIAGPCVYDTSFKPIDDLADEVSTPVITVYTALDNSDPAQKAGGLPFLRMVSIDVEMAVMSFAKRRDEAGNETGGFVASFPVTDAETEATLDLLEAQVRFALFVGPTGKLFRDAGGSRVRDIQSDVDRTSEERRLQAIRVMRITISAEDDCPNLVPTSPLTGLDRLPARLRRLYDGLPEGSYGRDVLGGIAEAAPVGPVRVPLQTVSVTLDVADPSGEVGQASITADVEIDQPAP